MVRSVKYIKANRKTDPKNTVTPTVSFVSTALARETRGMML